MTQIQAVNDLGNLIFIVFLLATVILTVLIAYRKFRGRGTRGLSWAIFIGLIAYAAILVGVSLDSQSRELALGTDKCFDDWCATVTGARSLPKLSARDDMKLVAITLRVSNRARRAAFRPSQPRVALVLSDGGVFTPSPTAQGEFEMQAGPQEDLAKRLLAGDGFQTTLVFEVPAATQEASVVVLEGPAAVTRFLVGDESSFFHKKMLYRIRLE
jgi:hypothetical protein